MTFFVACGWESECMRGDMRPCEYCGHPMPNNLKECPACGRPLSQSLSSIQRKTPGQDRSTEPPESQDSVVILVYVLVVLSVPALILGFCFGTRGCEIGFIISLIMLGVTRMLIRGF